MLVRPGRDVATDEFNGVPVALGFVPEVLEDAEQDFRSGCLIDAEVDLRVDGECRNEIAMLGGTLHGVDHAPQFGELVRRQLAVRPANRLDVEQEPDTVQILQLHDAERCDLSGSVRAEHDEALGLEGPQGFTDRDDACSEALRELVEEKRLACAEAPGENVASQVLDNELGGSAVSAVLRVGARGEEPRSGAMATSRVATGAAH